MKHPRNFLFVQQMVRSFHRKEAHILLKLDISKAFDSVSWPFLEVLCYFRFGQRWSNLLCLILATSSTHILVNGEPGDTIMHHRGLRQGIIPLPDDVYSRNRYAEFTD